MHWAVEKRTAIRDSRTFGCRSSAEKIATTLPRTSHIRVSLPCLSKTVTMKIAIVATLIASASAFSVNKAAFTQVRFSK